MTAPDRQTLGGWTLRPGKVADTPFLRVMFFMAAVWQANQPPTAEALARTLADPEISRYVRDWGRPGDLAIIAEDASARPIGAVWSRFFSPEEPGYGFIDAATPELGIAVVPELRGKGLGGALLMALLDAGRAAGFGAICLSVSKENPAVALYERSGFVRVGEVGGSWTMRTDLRR